MEHKKTNECNRSIFARMVLPAFICAHNWNSDIRAVYSRFMAKLNNDKNPDSRAQNDERRKILENCLNLFTDVALKKEIDLEQDLLKKEINLAENRTGDYERRPTYNEVTKRLLSVFPEKIFGDNKRTYNMSGMYNDGLVQDHKTPNGSTLKCVRVIPVTGAHIPSWSYQDHYGRLISLRLIGRLEYISGNGVQEYIGQYRVSIFKDDQIDDDEYTVYSNIDSDKMASDTRYYSTVFNELLSKNNMELSNSCGYIGEIVESKNQKKKLAVGEEHNENGFYRYQINPQYTLLYDSEHLSATIDYVKQQELIQQNITKANSDAR